MIRKHPLFVFFALIGASALQTGCAAHARAGAYAEAEPPVVFVGTPTLVALDANVWVVRDADRPTYYVDDSYWVVRDGVWYRSRSYDGGWARVEVTAVPVVIVSRNHSGYVHYQGDATAQTRPAPRAGEVVTSGAVGAPPSRGGPPGHDEVPGVGNQRKAEGEQPGHPTHVEPSPPDEMPNGHAHKEAAQPGPAPAPPVQPGPPGHGPPKKSDKKPKK